MESLEKPYTTRQRFFYALQPRKTISYSTSRYCQNIPFRRLNRYRNRAESYRPKYWGLPACFGYSGEFRSFSVIFSFRTDTNITGFFFKKLDAYSNLQQLVTIIEASTCQIINNIIFFFVLATQIFFLAIIITPFFICSPSASFALLVEILSLLF